MRLTLPYFRRSARGRRLLGYLSDGRTYQTFVRMAYAHPPEWSVVANADARGFTLETGVFCPLSAVDAFLLAYPSGEIMEVDGKMPARLPSGISYIDISPERSTDELSLSDLTEGHTFLRVTHDKGPVCRPHARPDDYITSLCNISAEPVRVQRFAGFRLMDNGRYRISTITGNWFTEEQFRAWYGCWDREWLAPGQTVADLYNYGGSSNGFWAYEIVTASGQQLTAGG
jgi:hypothetical protein